MNRNSKLRLTLAALLVAASSAAGASDWQWTVTPYAWATDVGIDVAIDDRQLIDEEISVEELLEDLDTIALVRLEAQKGAHGLFVDLFDVTLSDDTTTVALPSGAGDVSLTPEMGMTILDLGGLYDPQGDRRGFQLLYGARLLNERATIEAELHRVDDSTSARTFEIDDTFVDALVGIRYLRPIGRRFGYQVQADVSKGGTELTWSVGPSVAYAFGESGRYALTAGYRRMVVEFDTDSAVEATMTLSGALAGLRVTF